MMNESFAPPQVDEPPVEAGFAPSEGLAPVIESGSEDEEETQVPLEAPPPTPPLLLTCDAALTAPELAEPVGPVGPVEPVEPVNLSDDAPVESHPRVPDLVAAIEATLPPEVAEPPGSAPAPAEPPLVRPRRRGGPPMAVLVDRMTVLS